MSAELDPTSRSYYNNGYFNPNLPESKSSYRRPYDESFLWQIRFNSAAAHIFLESILPEIVKGKTARILDLGGAKGFLTKRLDRFPKVEAINLDFSDYATQNTAFRKATICGDIRAIPFKDDSFDILVGLDILEHLPPEDIQNFCNEAKRVLKPGGTMFFAIALEDEPFASRDRSHLSLKRRGWWEKEFSKACLPPKGDFQ